MRKTVVLAMMFFIVTLAVKREALSVENCDALWQRIGADKKLSSAFDKAKAMEQLGNACVDNVASMVRLSNYYIDRQHFDRAEAVVKSAMEKHPSSPELKDRAAFIALSRGDLETARGLAAELIRKNPGFASPYFTLGKIEVQSKNWDKALQYDRKSYELSGDVLVLPHIVAELHQLGHHEDAVNVAYRALKEMPSLVGYKLGTNEAIYSLGALGRFDEAVRLAERRMAADDKWSQDAVFVRAARKLGLVGK